MQITITMNESELGEAVAMWLKSRGMRPSGRNAVSVQHSPGDMREPSYTTVTVSAEPIQAGDALRP